jgi:hypothetical protein
LINEDKALLDRLEKQLKDEAFKGYEGGQGVQDMTAAIVIFIIGRKLVPAEPPCNGNCFDGKTLVVMSDGTYRYIRDVKEGDSLLSYDVARHKLVRNRVVRTSCARQAELVTVCFSNGDQIVTTANHLFYVNDQTFIRAQDLHVGASYRCRDGVRGTVTKVEKSITDSIWVYNLMVEGTHTFFVGKGELVHDLCQEPVPVFEK